MSTLAVIPARAGSKGLPDKNLRRLGGRTLVEISVQHALAAETVDRVVVSTDSDTIAEAARSAGAEAVIRPADLATDVAPVEHAVAHVLDLCAERERYVPEWVVLLEPTSPLRAAATIDRCVCLAANRQAGCVMTVVGVSYTLGRLDGDRFVHLPDQPRQRQLRQPLYREAGVAYVTRTTALREQGLIVASPLYAVVVSEEEAVDINTASDLRLAQALVRPGS